jgi:hypothetical protein
MKTQTLLSLLLFLVLSACATPATITHETNAPQPAPVIEESIPAPIVDTPALTLEQVLNTTYRLQSFDGNLQDFTVTNGGYQSGTDSAVIGYTAVFILREQVAFGDLNGDGASDAVVPMVLNFGGTGQFVFITTLLNQGGIPVHAPAATYGIGDRSTVNSLTLENGKIRLDAVLPGPEDAACCPTVPTNMTLEYSDMGWRVLHVTTTAITGLVREIVISAPADEAEVGAQVVITGNTTIGPFENNLVYRIYDANGMAVAEAGFMVQNEDIGEPATFELPLDFAALGLSGRIRVEISEMSMADGSTLMMDSVYLVVGR